MTKPIYLYYQLDGFYQNHRRYVKSRSDTQLHDPAAAVGMDKTALTKLCDPKSVNEESHLLYPCGVVAATVFTDSYHVSFAQPGSDDFQNLDVDERAETIAWVSDVEHKFTNVNPDELTGGKPNSEAYYMWLNEHFPPQICEWQGPASGEPFQKIFVARKPREMNGDVLNPPEADCDFQSDPMTCNFTTKQDSSELADRFVCEGPGWKRTQNPSGWGVENGHFIVWMRTAGLPNFRKLFGKVDRDLEKGTKVKVTIDNRYATHKHNGAKYIVLSTSSFIGGKNSFLGISYCVVGGCCIVFAIVFLFRHWSNPRKLGDVQWIQWHDGNSMFLPPGCPIRRRKAA
mmetsp:Transcript_27184/g.60146  ORF Transcript_27184/g.60146 Transcript_27184/m.60146 type:complete len:343 (+) Transcript_27184:1-1029(+)